MKPKVLVFLFVTFSFLISCNDSKEKMTIPASSDKIMMVQHPVANFENWMAIYNAHDSVRKSNGLTGVGVGRGIDDPNQLVIYLRMDDVAKAKEMVGNPEMKNIMDSAGVVGEPIVEYINTLRNDTSKTDIKDRVLVKHKVKDFDAWLKVYDDEGMEKRKSFGIVDRALGRGLDDPNMVYIVFAISDWEKANARMSSEELKKLMTDAGVEGEPMFFKYRFEFTQ